MEKPNGRTFPQGIKASYSNCPYPAPAMNPSQSRPPKKWKMMLISWLFVYPVINLLFALVFPLVSEFHQLVKTLIFTLILVPLMGVAIPLLHKRFWGWITR